MSSTSPWCSYNNLGGRRYKGLTTNASDCLMMKQSKQLSIHEIVRYFIVNSVLDTSGNDLDTLEVQ